MGWGKILANVSKVHGLSWEAYPGSAPGTLELVAAILFHPYCPWGDVASSYRVVRIGMMGKKKICTLWLSGCGHIYFYS